MLGVSMAMEELNREPGSVKVVVHDREASTLEGAGSNTLSRMLYGLERKDGGTLELFGETLAKLSPMALKERKMLYLNNNRKRAGLLLESTAADNMLLPVMKDFSKGFLVKRSAVYAHTQRFVDLFSIAIPSFIGVNGIDSQVGLTTQNMLECEIKRHMIESATQSFVLADSSKMCCIALGVICPVNHVDYVVTDTGASPSIVKRLEECGVEVMSAE